MAYDAESLTSDDFVTYRLMRFGEAGRFGEKGAKLAGRQHGVGARAWLFYESGHRRPSKTQRSRIARWLEQRAHADAKLQEVADYAGAKPNEP